MLVAVQQLLLEEIALFVAPGQTLDEFTVGMDDSERGRIIFTSRREELRPHPVMGSAKNNHQFGTLAGQQLGICMRVGSAATVWINVRGNQPAQSRAVVAGCWNLARGSGTVEEGGYLLPEL